RRDYIANSRSRSCRGTESSGIYRSYAREFLSRAESRSGTTTITARLSVSTRAAAARSLRTRGDRRRLPQPERIADAVADDLMRTHAEPDLLAYCEDLGRRARLACRSLATATGERKNAWLLLSANRLEESPEDILKANSKDIGAAPGFGLSNAQIDRLRL